MSKICIISSDNAFIEDLAQQIIREVPETEICFDEAEGCELLLVDEDEKKLQELSEKYKELPVVFFSATKDISYFADSVIKKPFVLADFLSALKNKTILPKVRRKECLNFKEYSLYPVKKEIASHKTENTLKLTEKEVEILKYLYQKFPEIVSKEDLLENVWGYSADVTTHTIETHIYRLRQKVEQGGGSQIILTENSGYRLNV